MRTLYFILQGRVKGFLPIFFYIVGVFIFFQNTGKAQGVDLKVVNYVEMLEGHTLSTQNGLLIPPNREIVYVVEVRNATSTSETFSNVTIEIAIPYYAEVYAYDSVDYYHGTKETSLSYSNKVITWKFTDVPGTQHQDTILAKLVYTLVSSNDCYALRNKCDKEIAVEGKYSGEGSDLGTFSDEPLAYGYHGSSSSNPVVVTFNAALVTSFLSKYCDGKDYREYVYLEGSTNIPVSDISDDFPAGAKFYDEINETTGVPTEPDLTLTGFPSTPARNEYYAWSSNTCWQKFYINVLDTTGIVYCAGEKMNDVVAWTEDWEEFNTTAISSGWYLGTEYIPDLSQRTLTLSDSSKKLTYKAEHVCEKDVVTSENEVEIIVYDKPEIVEFLEDSVYCAGEFLHMDMVMKANIYKDSTITYQWTFNGSVISTNSSVITTDYRALTAADSGKYLTLTITNSCGFGRDSVKIKVHPLPVVKINEETAPTAIAICSTKTTQLTGSPTQQDIGITKVEWKSLDLTKATVSTTGLVTGLSAVP
ncbi:MAG: Ig-like domain-containing protein, partial [Bacteroidales bacterium]|nr:Ig-like domain-containing protein [Bacteroidales bacterium]